MDDGAIAVMLGAVMPDGAVAWGGGLAPGLSGLVAAPMSTAKRPRVEAGAEPPVLRMSWICAATRASADALLGGRVRANDDSVMAPA